jgi:hypothetical protein
MSEIPPTVYCANHPQVEANLRCNRCEKPICTRCAVLTPTGYRCRECVRGQQKIFETAQWSDYPLAIGLTAFLSLLGSLLVPYLGFFTLFISPVAGVIISEVARVVVRRRRSKRLFQLTAAAAALGSLPPLLLLGLGVLGGSGSLRILLPLVWQVLYTFTVTSTVYYRLGGIRIR